MKYLVVRNESANKTGVLSATSRPRIYVGGDNKEIKLTLPFEYLDDLIHTPPKDVEEATINPKVDMAVILYIGGTSGQRMGVELPHFNLVANVIQSQSVLQSRIQFGEEVIITASPLYHVYMMTITMNLAVMLGAANVIVPVF
ncbi:AMP-binding protein [Peribacillus butanolivorans]|uniref:AMP-binding protein n=1 Tax=Peribacillus butanolivorans TaxID=421767 RepID=UPI0013C3081E|nr:AMP-binding protein [Peribacillus butanolivorans]